MLLTIPDQNTLVRAITHNMKIDAALIKPSRASLATFVFGGNAAFVIRVMLELGRLNSSMIILQLLNEFEPPQSSISPFSPSKQRVFLWQASFDA